MTSKGQITAVLTPSYGDDGEEWEDALVGPVRQRNRAPLPLPWDDASEWDDVPAAAPSGGRREASQIVAKLWIALFLLYTATALPLLVWALASVAA